ncbi:MAG: Verru_Chthon cassette protein A [Chthoniobacteraceae bacterium]
MAGKVVQSREQRFAQATVKRRGSLRVFGGAIETSPPSRGVALVLVLVFLVLLSGLVIALLTTARNESMTAHAYQSSVNARQLAAVATGLVSGQLLDGTHSMKVPGQNTSSRLAWASQPGMIRTWDDSGKGWKIFKLYSARDMVVDFPGSGRYSVADELANEVPDDWPAQTAHFVDLNEPVVVEDEAGPIRRDGNRFRASYPIVDPIASIRSLDRPPINPVDGFSINAPPGYDGQPLTFTRDPARPATPGRSGNPAPMPVRWIYVLKDGTYTVPTGTADGGHTATWEGAAPEVAPSRSNPIVGRLAFWTDDETCKLNVNTSSEPTPWDTPRAVTIQDLRYGRYQPAQKEYQRFPGHPLMSALSPVFFPGVKLTPAQKEEIYRLIPRVQPGGTAGASVAATGAIAPDEDRLYANVDEFLFRPEMPGDTRVENTLVSADRLRRARFFLTANSRAPELNLFGQPRIALWPLNSDPLKRTGYDKLAAFCSTIGSGANVKPFYFQRTDSTSPKADYESIARNRELYAYLQRLTAQQVPGYGGNFRTKWGADRDQILTEIFDYIRCANLRDPLTGATRFADNGQVAPIQIGDTQGFGRVHTLSQFGFHFICTRDPAKASAQIPDGGLKDAATLNAGERQIEVAFLFEPFGVGLGWYRIAENLYYEVNFISKFTVDGQDLKMQSAAKPLADRIGTGFHNNGREHGGAGGIRGPMIAFGGANYPFVSKAAPRVKVTASNGSMNFSGGRIQVKVFAGNSADASKLLQTFFLNFPGGKLPLPELVTTDTKAYRGCGTTTTDFWWTFATRYSRLGECPHVPGAEYSDPTRRWLDSGGPAGFKAGGIFRAEDVVRAIVPDHGDIRLIAAKTTVNPADFVKVSEANWESPAHRFLHVFTTGAGSHFHYGFANEPGPSPAAGIPPANADDQLVPSAAVKYHYSRLPEIRPGAGKLFNRWGDFDNGVATWADGAYINKPDEGNQASTNSPYTYFAWNFTAPTEVFFSPSRLVPSAGMLGSLPTGVKRHTTSDPHAWETLLFRPETRTAGGRPHPGTQTPRDHLLMDYFWMPVIEPYAISEPFSTAGKINLNYELAPFSYIRRATALHGALKAEEPLVLPNSVSKSCKLWDHETNDHPMLPSDPNNQDAQVRADWIKLFNGTAPFDKLRRPIDAAKTLAQADDRFAAGEIFRSASEICELHLVREGETLADYRNGSVWQNALITGDNTRERPYTSLYARLTTRSNTFTVHVRAQVLRQSGDADPASWAVWREDRSAPLSEFRGSTIIERYIDPADPNLPDFATTTDAVADQAYRTRVLATKKFTP